MDVYKSAFAYNKWRNTKACGKQIEGTRIIAFKTPQVKRGSNGPVESFNINDLLDAIPNLGLVIDLTFTTKYYQPENLLANGINYVKMYIEGKRVPPFMYLVKFCRIIDEFLSENKNDKLIGVHCTHGINRTGYMICSYMIKCLGIKPRDAIKRFESARGIRIENNQYLNELALLKPSYKVISSAEGDDLILRIPEECIISRVASSYNQTYDRNRNDCDTREVRREHHNSPYREINNRLPPREGNSSERSYKGAERYQGSPRGHHSNSTVNSYAPEPVASSSNYSRRPEPPRPYDPTLSFAAIVARNNQNNTNNRSVNNYRMTPRNIPSRRNSDSNPRPYIRPVRPRPDDDFKSFRNETATPRSSHRESRPISDEDFRSYRNETATQRSYHRESGPRSDDDFKLNRNKTVNPRAYNRESRPRSDDNFKLNRNETVNPRAYNRESRPRSDDGFKSWRNDTVNTQQPPRKYDEKRQRSPSDRNHHNPVPNRWK